MGIPCLASIQAPARAFGKAQTSSAHAVDGVDALLSPSSYRISELQVLNTVEVSDNQRQYSICYILFYYLFLIILF